MLLSGVFVNHQKIASYFLRSLFSFFHQPQSNHYLCLDKTEQYIHFLVDSLYEIYDALLSVFLDINLPSFSLYHQVLYLIFQLVVETL